MNHLEFYMNLLTITTRNSHTANAESMEKLDKVNLFLHSLRLKLKFFEAEILN